MGQNIQQKFNDVQNEVRLAIMNFIIDEKRPFHKQQDGFDALHGITQSGKGDFDTILAALEAKDGFAADEEGNINFIYPVSALPTHHQVHLADGRSFTAMCAIDAIGATFTFHQDTVIDSMCSACGSPVHIEMKNGVPAAYSPADLHALTFNLENISNWAGSC